MKTEWNISDCGKTRERIISDLKIDNIPVVIYGTGKFGKAVAEYVNSHGIPISYFLDDEKYWTPGKTMVVNGERRVECLTKTQLLKRTELFNMLLGMIDYSLLDDLKEEFKSCHYVEYLDVFPPHIMTGKFLSDNRNIIKKYMMICVMTSPSRYWKLIYTLDTLAM